MFEAGVKLYDLKQFQLLLEDGCNSIVLLRLLIKYSANWNFNERNILLSLVYYNSQTGQVTSG